MPTVFAAEILFCFGDAVTRKLERQNHLVDKHLLIVNH